ncbi:MAG TPA: hypothetical protein VK203_00215 [Nostocaceae cyanobacterium]|nr:hypothetical protein [Nostocaceae cyanobacterium]
MLKFAQSLAFMPPVKDFPAIIFSGKADFPYRWGLTFVLIAGLYSCSNFQNADLGRNKLPQNANVTPIREIKQPAQGKQVTVYIQGTIAKQAALIGQKVYQIDDSTGKIWVVTNQNNLQVGQQVVLKGKVQYQSIPLGGREYGEVYLIED